MYNGMIDIPASVLKNGAKDFTCPVCGETHQVRKDTHPVLCGRCARSKAGRGNAGRVVAKRIPCACCGKMIRKSSNSSYCSVKCRRASIIEKRTCKCCGKEFEIYLSALKTNASGNFCTRACYEKWMCKTDRTSGRGSQWKRKRGAAVERTPYCAFCGSRENLEVHHIVPFRLTYDNSPENFIVLCKRHHKVVEALTHEVEDVDGDYHQMGFLLRNIFEGKRLELMGRALIRKREISNEKA